MFKAILDFLIKRAPAILISAINFSVEPSTDKRGGYLLLLIEVYGRVLIREKLRIPVILDIDTVRRKDGTYLRIRAEFWELKLKDIEIKISDSRNSKIDVNFSDREEIKKLEREVSERISENAQSTLNKNSMFSK